MLPPEPDVLEWPSDLWPPTDLRSLPAREPLEVGLSGLGYPGKVHAFVGPPEAAKTTVGYIVLLEEARRGRPVMIVDFEMGAHDARDRLRDLGATDDDFDLFHFFEPPAPAKTDTIGRILDLVRPTVVFVDAAAGAYDLHGLDDNKRADAQKIHRLIVGPCRARNVAAIIGDHVVKDREQRGRGPIGSERKLGAVDVALTFEPKTPFSRGKTGTVAVNVAKDRFGHLRRPHLTEIELVSHPENHAISWTFRDPASETADGGWRPTVLINRALEHLAGLDQPVSRSAVAAAIGKNKQACLRALDILVNEGHVTETPGPKNAKLLTLTRTAVPEPFPERVTSDPYSGSTPYKGEPLRNGSLEPDELDRLHTLGETMGLTT